MWQKCGKMECFYPLKWREWRCIFNGKRKGDIMSVFKRKTTAGQTSEYHYRFMMGGKRYSGVCIECYSKDDAIKYETSVKQKVAQLCQQRSVKALVENFKVELSGDDRTEIAVAWEKFAKKPSRRNPSAGYLQKKKARWETFVDFMKTGYPEIRYIHEVTKSHAEAYVSFLRSQQKASSTANAYQKCAAEIFSKLISSGMESPFDSIQLLSEKQETREAFTEQELELILSTAPPFIKAIFVVGFLTALREGDIATLKWSEVLWEQGIIRRKLLKTSAVVEIPIMPPLAKFLREQYGNSYDYVLPEHAKMYMKNPSGISYRVKKFLEEDLNIKTTKKIPGRTREISIKDVHSLRHTFCYFAGVAGIPLVIVQSIIGHMTKEMTAHYTAHADRQTKKEKLAALPYFRGMLQMCERKILIQQLRERIISAVKIADSATLEKVAALLMVEPKTKTSLLRNTEPEKSN
jgi:integrase